MKLEGGEEGREEGRNGRREGMKGRKEWKEGRKDGKEEGGTEGVEEGETEGGVINPWDQDAGKWPSWKTLLNSLVKLCIQLYLI